MTEWGIDTLFNPSKRYMDDEKRRLQSTREEVGDSSGGRRIDLDSGKLVIRRPKAAAGDSDAEAGQADAAQAEAGEADAEAGQDEAAHDESGTADPADDSTGSAE